MIRRIIPPPYRRQTRYAFGRGESARPLRIFVDCDTVTDSDELTVLLTFAKHGEVEVIGTDERFPNVLSVDEYDAGKKMTRFEIKSETRHVVSAVPGNNPRESVRWHAPAEDQAAAARALLTAKIAIRQQVDALATGDAYLLESFSRKIVEGANPTTVGDAVALLGLFIRCREDRPTIDVGETWSYFLGRATFYWELMREVAPSSWRWFSACAEHSTSSGDDALLFTAQSALERIERSFRARDRLHEQLQYPRSREAAMDAVFYFDVGLFMLGGAFDVLAKVAHVVHGFGVRQRQALWSNKSWMAKLAVANPPLAQMMEEKQPCRDAHQLVSILRNTIHQDALRTSMWRARGGGMTERVTVPIGVEKELEDVVARLGSAEKFGLSRERVDGRLYIEPGIYFEEILPLVFAAMNALMDATPVEALSGVDPAKVLTGPPAEDDVFGVVTRDRVRLLGGVG